ncbi:amino acid carrier protein [Halocola ammonii]
MGKTITRVFLVAVLFSFSSVFYAQNDSIQDDSSSNVVSKEEANQELGNEHEEAIEEEGGVTAAINSVFEPVVAALTEVLFWDPFEAIGIYDPRVITDKVSLKASGWQKEGVETLHIKRWLVEDGDRVERAQKIGEVETNLGGVHGIYAREEGTIQLDAKEGEKVYDPNDDELAIDVRSHLVATIHFDQEQPLIQVDDKGRYLTTPKGEPIPEKNSIPIVVVWLILGATFFTFRMKFINFRGIKHAVQLVRGDFSNPNDKGEVSHFQALATALSATVGLGNIAGVAVAITLGGPGASFWIIIAGLLGMTSKFVECTLAVKYRDIDENGKVYGGPMYYLSKALKLRGMAGLGKTLAIVFAVLCILASFGGGNMFQSNQAFEQVRNVFGGQFENIGQYGFWFGVVLAVLVGIVIVGGIRSIAKVTDKIVPLMVGVYVIFALLIIFFNFDKIGFAFSQIIDGAFNATALKGGFIGVLVIGFQRAAFSNEAGVGSASIAHSASKTNEPISEGIVALMEPFIDTVVVCTMTALVLIFTGFADGSSDFSGAALTAEAFSSVFPWFNYVLLVAIILFAFSTMISWSYYGLKSWTYLFGVSNTSEYIYKGLFLLFIIVGASSSLGAVLDFSDMMILGMAFPNILGLYILSKEVYRDLQDYFKRVKTGEIKKYK